MRLAPILLFAAAAHAQSLIPASRVPQAIRAFERPFGESEVRCEVSQIRPSLNFTFRFQAGYGVRIPMNQYFGPGHRWAILTKITPDGGQPAYLLSNIGLPDVPKTKVELEFGGAFLLGEGRYHVQWVLFDDQARTCRKEWDVDVHLSHGERKVKVAMPAATVADLSGRGLRGARIATDDAAPFRLTVLLHAAPLSPRRQRVSARDRNLLLGTLSSLLDRLPTRSVRLVVFNLDKQKELLRQDDFQRNRLDRVAQAIDQMELGLVDVSQLENKRGHVALLADLVNQEISAAQQSDVVLFLGPSARFFDKVPGSAVNRPTTALPRFFYLEYKPPFLMEASLPDSIHSAVAKLRGKTVIIRTPADFAKAIEQVERKAASN